MTFSVTAVEGKAGQIGQLNYNGITLRNKLINTDSFIRYISVIHCPFSKEVTE
jgi:hypothetical protein